MDKTTKDEGKKKRLSFNLSLGNEFRKVERMKRSGSKGKRIGPTERTTNQMEVGAQKDNVRSKHLDNYRYSRAITGISAPGVEKGVLL